MSIDRRLRRDLEQEASRIQVDVERNLGAVEARTRHRGRSLTPILVGAVAIAAIALFRFVPAPSVGPSASEPGPTVSAAATANPFASIAGIYRTTLNAAADPAVAGTWTMELRPNGTIALAPPATFGYGSVSPSGISYSIEGDRLRTDMFYNDFCASVGAYRWSLRGETLTLTPTSETCAVRRALLATSPWTKLPAAS